ncbi:MULTISPECIES: nuclear transport factor 2 family protein [Streptomyces]|uniref:nuclear transport factor 2 family protein n=1 Tax=Streptomyces TaxID=1883 RepID=UPI0029C156C0|nr:nuclear transport factor 2 family protein [Streptomyces sp. ID01-9D]MDX5574471.1 nuclear transport factor 2 family protein [Streptomyces sp. ID01-9D]WSV21129.1 nuclear transport factor 2 family protein [Streptomyces fimicarius]
MNDTFTAYDPATLPTPVLAYLDAHDESRYADVAAVFAPDATVLDDGKTYEGIEEIRAWAEKSATEFTYTSTRIGQRIADDRHVVVRVRLDGNFPGGTVTLRYRFLLDAGRIGNLAIEV